MYMGIYSSSAKTDQREKEREEERNREKKREKREKQREKERKGQKKRENNVQGQLLSICNLFSKRKTNYIGINARNLKKWPRTLDIL